MLQVKVAVREITVVDEDEDELQLGGLCPPGSLGAAATSERRHELDFQNLPPGSVIQAVDITISSPDAAWPFPILEWIEAPVHGQPLSREDLLAATTARFPGASAAMHATCEMRTGEGEVLRYQAFAALPAQTATPNNPTGAPECPAEFELLVHDALTALDLDDPAQDDQHLWGVIPQLVAPAGWSQSAGAGGPFSLSGADRDHLCQPAG